MSKKYLAATLVVMGAAGGQASALEPQGYRTAEGLVITPALTVSERWDDNFRAVETDEESSFITTINPNLSLGVRGRKSEFNLNFDASHDVFHSSHDDNNTDRKATAMLALAFDARNRLRLDAGINHVEETASLVQKFESDVYELANAGVLYGFGAESARAQLELGFSQDWLRFKNELVLPDSSILNEDRERDARTAKATLYLALAPKTKVLVEARHTEYEYVTFTLRDSTNLALLGGVQWDATAKTRGSIKVGTEEKEFDAGGETDNTMWEASVSWSPLSYSTFTLSTNSRIDEGLVDAVAIETQSTSLSWDHKWLERLKSSVSVSTTDQDYLVLAGPARADEIVSAGVGVTYSMRRWLDVGLGYRFMENDSNAAGRSFERNIVGAHVAITL